MIALGCDHAGLPLMNSIRAMLAERGVEVKDFGTHSPASCDYAAVAQKTAQAVASGECERGILCCGTGVGISIAANKVHGIRCVVCTDCYSAKMSRMHNDANMLALGARVIGEETGKMIVELWLNTPFEGGRHQRRVDQIMAIEQGKNLDWNED